MIDPKETNDLMLYIRFMNMHNEVPATSGEMKTENMTISDAMRALTKAMEEDPSYAYTWHANIAMMMQDAMPVTFWMPDKKLYHGITNDAAARFMKLAFKVETSATMLETDKTNSGNDDA